MITENSDQPLRPSAVALVVCLPYHICCQESSFLHLHWHAAQTTHSLPRRRQALIAAAAAAAAAAAFFFFVTHSSHEPLSSVVKSG